jgi:hypothetical protein
MQTRFLMRAMLCAAILAAPAAAGAQDDKLSVHGSINTGYARTDGLPNFGANKDGTTDYRSVTLQFGYKVSEQDRVVIQLLNRKLGTSPLNAVTPDVQPVWAFYEHKFGNGISAKLGRSPIPRGLFNEIRYIGTLLPLYRVGGTGVYGETFEFIDGAVISKKFDLGGDWAIESAVFGGGFSVKATIPTATGISVVNQREESAIGTQVWLETPIRGVKVGGFLSSYQPTPAASIAPALRPNRNTTYMVSAEASFDRVFARSEYQAIASDAPNFVDVKGWYVQGGVKPHEQLSFTAEYGGLNNTIRFPAPVTNEIDMPVSRELILGVAWKQSAQVAFKAEVHRYDGYNFDTPVPAVIAPTGPPFVATLAPASKVNMLIASVAVSF